MSEMAIYRQLTDSFRIATPRQVTARFWRYEIEIVRQLQDANSAVRRSCRDGRDGIHSTIAVQVRRTLRQSHLPLRVHSC